VDDLNETCSNYIQIPDPIFKDLFDQIRMSSNGAGALMIIFKKKFFFKVPIQ